MKTIVVEGNNKAMATLMRFLPEFGVKINVVDKQVEKPKTLTAHQQSLKEWKNGETTKAKNFKEIRYKLAL